MTHTYRGLRIKKRFSYAFSGGERHYKPFYHVTFADGTGMMSAKLKEIKTFIDGKLAV